MLKLLRFWPLLIPLALATLIVLVTPPGILQKKAIALLILPSGLVWIGLSLLVFWPGLSGLKRWAAVALFLVYSLSGNMWFGNFLIRSLEASHASYTTPLESLDALLVLGGGTRQPPTGPPALGSSGDRVLSSARLFLEGKARYLVASGHSMAETGPPRDLSEETSQIWSVFGIPQERILQLPEARNTEEEIVAFNKMVQERDWRYVGICSSASHLRRAKKLADREGLEFVAVPADFLSTEIPVSPIFMIPQSNGFEAVERALWEYLGALAIR